MKAYVIITASAAMFTAGCASFTSPAREHALENGKSYWIDYDASRRGALMVATADGKWSTCSEPAPDVALNLVNKLEGDLTASDIKIANAKGDITVSAIKLAERTQMIMFLRESLYRLCELSMNHQLEQDKAKELYSMVISTALAMEQKAQAETVAVAEKAKAETKKFETTNTLLGQGLDKSQIQKFLQSIQ